MQAVKSVAMPDDRGRVDPGLLESGRHGDAEHVDVVRGDLQGPLGRQRRAVGELPVEDGVRVVVGRGPELDAVGDPHHEGPAGQRAEVHADDDAVGAR